MLLVKLNQKRLVRIIPLVENVLPVLGGAIGVPLMRRVMLWEVCMDVLPG